MSRSLMLIERGDQVLHRPTSPDTRNFFSASVSAMATRRWIIRPLRQRFTLRVWKATVPPSERWP